MSNYEISQDFAPFDSHAQWDLYNDPSQLETQESKLGFCQYSNWDSDETYHDDPPNYIQYSIEWKVALNKRMLSKDTEQEVVLSPADCWEYVLKEKLNDVKSAKMGNRAVRSEDTTVVISVTQRGVLPLTRRFDLTSIDWTVMERQLVEWSEYFRAGKKLRLSLSFNYVDNPQSTNTTLQRPGRRGRPSRTQQMLAEREEQLNAEEASSGQTSVLVSVYRAMRCSGHPCQLGPYCWVDPVGEKHYKLGRTQIESLVRYVQQGHTLLSHDDVPEDIRQQLYAAAEQSLEKHKKTASTSTSSATPFTINVLPASCHHCSVESSTATTLSSSTHSISTGADPCDIPGFLDDQVEDYCGWQQSRVRKTTLKSEYKKACDVMLEDGITLRLIHRDPNPDFLTKKGIKRGIAQHIVDDVEEWVDVCKRIRTEEQLD